MLLSTWASGAMLIALDEHAFPDRLRQYCKRTDELR